MIASNNSDFFLLYLNAMTYVLLPRITHYFFFVEISEVRMLSLLCDAGVHYNAEFASYTYVGYFHFEF